MTARRRTRTQFGGGWWTEINAPPRRARACVPTAGLDDDDDGDDGVATPDASAVRDVLVVCSLATRRASFYTRASRKREIYSNF